MTQVLYAARGGPNTTSDLYTVDPATGVMTSVGAIGFAMTGLAEDPLTAILYGITSFNSAVHPHALVTVDPVTGAGTFIAAESQAGGGIGIPWTDIAFDSLGNLYALGQGGKLLSVDKATGVGTVIGTPVGGSSFGGAVSFNSADLGYAAPKGGDTTGRLYSVTTAGIFTPLALFTGPLTAGWRLTAFAFGDLDVLWGADGDHLVTVDVATSAVTVIGAMLADVDALGFVTVTTPTVNAAIFDGSPTHRADH